MKIGFITCNDLSRYYTEMYLDSKKPYRLTHDDMHAFEDLQSRGWQVEPVVWGVPIADLVEAHFHALIVRCPWDYMDTEETRLAFLEWLRALDRAGVRVLNHVNVCVWSLDKHYLADLNQFGVAIVPSEFLEPGVDVEARIRASFAKHGAIVVKPTVAAAAKDANLIRSTAELETFLVHFARIRTPGRAFLMQPFIADITTVGEYSCVFLAGQFSHAVLKLPKAGGEWRVQDELGGSVQSLDAPADVRECAEFAFSRLAEFVRQRFDTKLLYCRVDILPGLALSEVELVEPELHFLDRRTGKADPRALQLFYEGICESLK